MPPDDALDHLDEFLDHRRDAADFRWTLREQLHVTLAFLADVPDRAVDDLEARLERAAKRRTAFRTALTGGGAFPNVGRARVLWAGLELDEPGRVEMARLATGARAAASKAGIAVDGARFKPHVTVARLKRPQESTPWVRLLDAYRGPAWTVESVASWRRTSEKDRASGRATRPWRRTRSGDDHGGVRTVLAVMAALLATACSAGTDSQPSPASPQASPSPDLAASAPHGRWQITVASGSAYYPGGANQQEMTIRIVCDDECVGTIETESGVIRTVRWDGERLRVALPAHETGAAKCFDAQPVARTGHLDDDRGPLRRAGARGLGARRRPACRPGSWVATTRR